MNCFKARLAPGRNFRVTFKKKQGFISCDTQTLTTTDIITEILEENPNSNQTEIVRLANTRGYTKRQIEGCLKDGEWARSSGRKNSTLYRLPAKRSEGDEAGI